MSVEELNNEAAVKALSLVARQWLQYRGPEAYIVVDDTRSQATDSYQAIPVWARDKNPTATDESGAFARKMLAALQTGEDDEVSVWTDQALKEVTEKDLGQVLDPITMAIAGAVLIGAILAARVRKVGSLEFYEGVPKELADVLKVASAVPFP